MIALSIRRLTLALVLLLLLNLVLYASLVAPEKLMLADQEGTHAQSSRLLTRQMQRKEGIQAQIRRYEDTKTGMAEFRREHLRRQDERIVELSRLLADRAQAHQIRLDLVRYSAQDLPQQRLILYRAEFPAEGTYSSLRRFIEDLEQGQLLLVISQLELEESGQFQQAVRAHFRLTTFFEETP
jgi:hypothetical protein